MGAMTEENLQKRKEQITKSFKEIDLNGPFASVHGETQARGNLVQIMRDIVERNLTLTEASMAELHLIDASTAFLASLESRTQNRD